MNVHFQLLHSLGAGGIQAEVQWGFGATEWTQQAVSKAAETSRLTSYAHSGNGRERSHTPYFPYRLGVKTKSRNKNNILNEL